MKNLTLGIAALRWVSVVGTRLRSVPARCVAELPVAAGWGDRADFEKVLTRVLPDVVRGYGKNSSVVVRAKTHGQEDKGEGCLEDVYGEVTPEGLTSLYGLLNLADDDFFVDLGSGLGKLPIQAAVLGGAKAAMGVELSARRHALACKGLEAASTALWAQLKGEAPPRTSRVELVRADMFEQDLSQATVVFMNSLCFRDSMMAELGQKLARELPVSARIASLKPFGTGSSSRLAAASASVPTIDTTWSPSVEVWLFRAQGARPGDNFAPSSSFPGKPPPK